MNDSHPFSPEARRRALARLHAEKGRWAVEAFATKSRRRRFLEVLKRVGLGLYDDGFIHAGNLAYISLLALFPFVILAAAIAKVAGQGQDSQLTVVNILAKLPPDVARVLAGPIHEVLDARTGNLLWFGALVGLWTAGSFIETIRDILRRAYGVAAGGGSSFLKFRLGSIALIVSAVILLLAAFAASVALTSIHEYLVARLPFSNGIASSLGLYRLIPGVTMYCTFYFLFLALTPARYRTLSCRKWPGALLVTLWWLLTVQLLPGAVGAFGGYAITYGSLAGVMVVLIFFYVIGMGVVAGAELNAALADAGETALEGEHYEGPYARELEVARPGDDETVRRDSQ